MIATTLTIVTTGPSVSWDNPVAIKAGNMRSMRSIHVMGFLRYTGLVRACWTLLHSSASAASQIIWFLRRWVLMHVKAREPRGRD